MQRLFRPYKIVHFIISKFFSKNNFFLLVTNYESLLTKLIFENFENFYWPQNSLDNGCANFVWRKIFALKTEKFLALTFPTQFYANKICSPLKIST